MIAGTQIKSPFNFIQVVIAALGASYLNVITYFIGGSAGASWKVGDTSKDVIGFDQILISTIVPLAVFGLIVFLIGRAKPGICKVAQWVGLIIAVVSIISPIMAAADVATAVTLSVIHLITGVAWFFAVHYGNKQLHIASQEVVVA